MFFESDLLFQITGKAIKDGVLIPLNVETNYIKQGSINFIFKKNLAIKKKISNLTNTPQKKVDPFLPIEILLHFSTVNQNYELILNKFVVVKNHLLLVTSKFFPQNEDLTMEDFQALDSCIQPSKYSNWLVFFNQGMKSGASQPHKHIQIVPLIDLETKEENFPLNKILDDHANQDKKKIDIFDFKHGFCSIKGLNFEKVYEKYINLIKELELNYRSKERKVLKLYSNLEVGIEHSYEYSDDDSSYNLLLTSNWILIVPRKEENFLGISLNSLGFLGSFFGSKEEMEELEKFGILKFYKELTFKNV